MARRPERCMLLGLPVELRLRIYDFALHAPPAVTISSGLLTDGHRTCSCADQQTHNLDRCTRTRRVPFIRNYLDTTLLLDTTQRVYQDTSSQEQLGTDGWKQVEDSLPQLRWTSPFETDLALRQVCQTINNELQSFRRAITDRHLDLYIAYPHGLSHLWNHGQHLLSQCRSLHVSGQYYHDAGLPEPQRRFLNPDYHVFTAPFDPDIPEQDLTMRPRVEDLALLKTANDYLSKVCTFLMSGPGSALFEMLELRIYYPDPSRYGKIWSDENSTISVALPHISDAYIDLECWRSRLGTGVFLKATPDPGKRTIRTSWRHLGNTKAENEGFVISENWSDDGDDITKMAGQQQPWKVDEGSGTRYSGGFRWEFVGS